MASKIRCAAHATSSISQKLALTSPTSVGRSVAIIRLRTQATEFVYMLILIYKLYYRIDARYVVTCLFRATTLKSRHEIRYEYRN
jgi:hypothetical protein